MSTLDAAIQTYANQVEANFATLTSAIANLQTGVTALDASIQQLQQELGSQSLSQASQTLLAKLVSDSATLVTAAQAINVALPAAPAPPAPPATPAA